MAGNDVRQKIVLEGEREYNKAISDAKRNLKTLRSELKAETAELGRNATEQQKNEAKVKSLQKQIKEQEKVVKTYQEALKQVKENYSDNEDAIAKWEQKLNDARTALANMKNDLDGVGKSFKEVEGSADMATVATKSVADSFGKLSEIGGAISDGIESAFTGLLSTAKDTISQIWGDITDLAARSNNLVDLAGFWNTDPLTIQKYAGAVSEVSGTLEDLNSIVTKINSGDKKKIVELTGVSAENYKDQWQYAMAVMTAMSQMGKERRNEVAFDIFGGRQATKAFDLLNDWNNLLNNLYKYDSKKGGYGLSEEELSTMSDLYDKVNGLKQSWQSLKDMATVKLFGDLSIQITGNAQAIMDALLKYLNANSDEERDEALEEIEKNITEMFETAAKAIEDGIALLDKVADNLKESGNPTAKALGNILSGLVDVLQWFTEDNMNNVVKAMEILAVFWVAGKGLQMATTIAELAANLKAISISKLLTGNFGGAGLGGLGNAVTVNTVSQAISQSAGGLAEGIVNALTSTTGIIGVGIMMMAPLVAKLFEKKDPKLEQAEETLKEMSPDPVENIKNQLQNPEQSKNALRKILGVDPLPAEEKKESIVTQALDAWLQNGQNTADYWKQQYEIQKEAQDYSYSEHMSIDEIMEDLERRRNEGTSNGGNSGNSDGLTSGDAKDMTGAVRQMPREVAKAIGGIRVYMNGTVVGQLVADEVSRQIAAQIV